MSPSARTLWLWFALALLVRGALALSQTQPGYMDAAYYYNIAASLARGDGLQEDFLWNYLTHPARLPQPSNAYWMPLTSLVVAPFLWLFGNVYRAAQLPMVLLSALLVPLAYGLSLRLYARHTWATLSAVLMLASSFYLPFWSAIDSFALYGLLGTGALLLATRANDSPRSALVCGVVIALAHLTRADGFLLFVPALYLWWRGARRMPTLALMLIGYALLMLPWFARNLLAFGTPLPGGGTLFLRAYDDLFSYEKSLTLDYWLGAGWEQIIATKVRALVLNLATLAGALHFVFFPFALIGAWRARQNALVRGALLYLLALYTVMSLLLSVPGPRGTFLHSLTAVLPLFYALAPAGLNAAIEWIARRRRTWNAAQAMRVFGGAFTLLAVLLSGYFFASNVFGLGGDDAWNERFTVYWRAQDFLRAEGAARAGPVMVINPPAFYYFTQRAAIALPSDDPLALIHAAEQFGARYFILEPDHPRYFDSLYDFSVPDGRFRLLATFADARGAQVQLYQIVPLR